jgi:hypothetical protein
MIFKVKISRVVFMLQQGYNLVDDIEEFLVINGRFVDFYYKFWRNHCGLLIKS